MTSPFGAWSTVSSVHFEWFFLWPQVVCSHTCGEKYLAKYLRPNLCRSPEFCVHVVLFLHDSVLRILMTLISLRSQLCLLSVGSLTVSAWVPPPCTTAWKTLKPGNEGSCRAGLIHFLCLSDHTIIPCFIYLVHLGCFRQKGGCSPHFCCVDTGLELRDLKGICVFPFSSYHLEFTKINPANFNCR